MFQLFDDKNSDYLLAKPMLETLKPSHNNLEWPLKTQGKQRM